MKKLMDKLLNNIRFDKKYVLFSLVILIIGIICGSLFIIILNSSDKNIVIEYIQSFITNIQDNKYNLNNLLLNTSLINLFTIFIMIICCLTVFLIPINIILLFYKSFILGFSISSFILTYKFKGLIYSIIYIFPHQIINLLLFSLLTAFTLKLTINMIKYIIKKKDINMRIYFNKFIYIIIFSIIILIFTTLYEVFIVPFIIKLI